MSYPLEAQSKISVLSAKLIFTNKKNIVKKDSSIGHSIQVNNYILKKSAQNNDSPGAIGSITVATCIGAPRK